jgi:hypothetical protein
MDLSPDELRRRLALVDAHGWDSQPGRDLMNVLRSAVVQPIVRRAGLTGPAADQAIASGWATAWEAVRRPSVRTAENPAGIVWVAVRRAVWTEAEQTRELVDAEGPILRVSGPEEEQPTRTAQAQLGRLLTPIVDVLVELGWERGILEAAIEELADHCTHEEPGVPRVRWRWVSLRLGLPEWQARRLAVALLGVPGRPGVLAMVAAAGPGILRDEGVRRVLRATCRRNLASPGADLASWPGLTPACIPEGACPARGDTREAGGAWLKIA